MKYWLVIICLSLFAGCGMQDEKKPLRKAHFNSSSFWDEGHGGSVKTAPKRLEDQVLTKEGMDAERVSILDMMDRVMEEGR